MEPSAILLGNALENPKRKRAALVEDCFRIDAADLRRSAVFRHGESGRLIWTLGDVEIAWATYCFTRQADSAGELEFEFHQADQRKRTRIALETTIPHFGGKRVWLTCPRCERRMRTLFAKQRELEPACRGCHGLQFRSAQGHDARVDALRKNEEKFLAMLFDSAGTLSARLSRVRLVAKTLKAIEREQAKRMRARRK